jgi:hypothetical protein
MHSLDRLVRFWIQDVDSIGLGMISTKLIERRASSLTTLVDREGLLELLPAIELEAVEAPSYLHRGVDLLGAPRAS